MEPPSNLPTEKVTETKTVSGSPTSFSPRDHYPGIITAFDIRNLPSIDKLSNLLNQGLYYNSDGQVDLPWMRSVGFNFGTSSVPSVDLKNLMGFAKQMYKTIYTDNEAPYKLPLKPNEIHDKIELLKTSPFLTNLPSTNPMGQLSSKIGGNIKSLILDTLAQIR
jgi:hypothetical protein